MPEQIAGALEEEILDNRLESGARVALRSELIERFAVSASAMNEALRILRERGVIAVKPGPRGGVFVAEPPPQVRLGVIDLWFRGLIVDPVELFEARALMEDSFAVVAAERSAPHDVRDIEWALDELRNVRDDPRSYLEANIRFHMAIARAARVPVLAGMYETIATLIRGTLVRAEFFGAGSSAVIDENIEVHARILAAIRERDQVMLAAALLDHRADLIRVSAPSRSPRRDVS